MLHWSEQFETGDALIDSQHRMLITYFNSLSEVSRSTNLSPEEIGLLLRFIEFLEDYMIMHFKAEENCMNRFRCPAYHDNKRAHTEFLDFFRSFKLRLDSLGCRPELVKELQVSCNAWIKHHILRIDVQLKASLAKTDRPEEGEQNELR